MKLLKHKFFTSFMAICILIFSTMCSFADIVGWIERDESIDEKYGYISDFHYVHGSDRNNIISLLEF